MTEPVLRLLDQIAFSVGATVEQLRLVGDAETTLRRELSDVQVQLSDINRQIDVFVVREAQGVVTEQQLRTRIGQLEQELALYSDIRQIADRMRAAD